MSDYPIIHTQGGGVALAYLSIDGVQYKLIPVDAAGDAGHDCLRLQRMSLERERDKDEAFRKLQRDRDEAISECRRRVGLEQDIAHWRERTEDAEAALTAICNARPCGEGR